MEVLMKKRTSNVKITCSGGNGRYTLVVDASVAVRKMLQYKEPVNRDSIKAILAICNDLKNTLLQKEYKEVVHSTKTSTTNAAHNKHNNNDIKITKITKITKQNRPHDFLKTCKNQKTILNYNLDLQNVEDKDSIIMLGSGNCFIIDEIAGYWASGSFKDPLDLAYSLSDDDLRNVLSHDKLDQDMKKQILDLMASKEALINLLRDNHEIAVPYVRAVIAAALLSLIDFDKENSYPVATTAIAGLRDFSDKRLSTMKDSIFSISANNGESMNSILDASGSCIHAKAISMLCYGLFLAHKLNVPHAVPTECLYRMDDVDAYVLAFSRSYKGHVTSVNDSNDLIYQAVFMGSLASTTFVRIGFISKRNGAFLRKDYITTDMNMQLVPRIKTVINRSKVVYAALCDKVLKTKKTRGDIFTNLFAMLDIKYPDP